MASNISQRAPLLLLLFLQLLQLNSLHASGVRCLPDQALALLRLKKSFDFTYANTQLTSWRASTDCCHGWEGVSCDAASGRVVALNLTDQNLSSGGLDSALFSLTSLQNLSLAGNYFNGSHLPTTGFERLTKLIKLNLSDASFTGQIPIGIAHLTNLLFLDLSSNYIEEPWQVVTLQLQEPRFERLIANLSNLRELYLDFVNMSSSGAHWWNTLAESVPKLEALSLEGCSLPGTIPSWTANLTKLSYLDLSGNRLYGTIPSWIANLTKLSYLDLSRTRLNGTIPSWIANLSKLSYLDLSYNNLGGLDLSYNNLGGTTPSWIANLTKLSHLDLSRNNLNGRIPSWIANLSKLSYLDLTMNNLSGIIPSSIGNLTQLTHLCLAGNNLKGIIPSSIGNLTQLTHLGLGANNLKGTIPSWIANFTKLTYLDLTTINHHGTIPSWIANLTKLTYLELSVNNLTGTIPFWIANLTKLTTLDLSDNNLTGRIPEFLFKLPTLTLLDLQSNQLSSPLPDFINTSLPLSQIFLSDNELSGDIPRSFFLLVNLQVLSLASNKFTGIVELSAFAGLRSLTTLALSNNRLSVVDGENHSLFSSFPQIEQLFLASCNLTKLPIVLRYLDSIQFLDLSCNQIDGVIPKRIWETWKDSLLYLNLSHNMFTSVEHSPSLVPMVNLQFLDLSFNKLQGNIPIPQISVALQVLDYSNNQFSYILPNFTSICGASNLQLLDLSYNNFTGSIPSCLIEVGNMKILNLRGNQFEGMLPRNIRHGCALRIINLNGNQINGRLPRTLSNCNDLEVLDLGSNHIVDSFPSWLGNLPKLKVLVLRSNKFHGLVGNSMGGNKIGEHFSSLQIIDLASNNFSGNLHSGWFNNLKSMMVDSKNVGEVLEDTLSYSEVYYGALMAYPEFYYDAVTITYKDQTMTNTKVLTAFKMIDFSNNAFYGGIPESIGKLALLHGLNMSHNAFTGPIPPQLGGITPLESLDLSWNKLSGEIPQELTSLHCLAILNLSYNNLIGKIPQEQQFLSFDNSSFEGNEGLCGHPLSKPCTDDSNLNTSTAMPSSNSDSGSDDRIDVILLFAFSGLGFGVGFTLVIVLQMFCEIRGWSCKYFLSRRSCYCPNCVLVDGIELM